MPTTPYARLLVALNGGTAAAGGIEAAASDSVTFAYESTVGWPAQPAPYLEIYEAPLNWAPDPLTGWIETDGGGWKYYGTTPPPAIAAPDAAHFGKVACQLVVGGGLKAGKLSADMTSGATILVRSASVGLESTAARETTEFDPIRSWIGAIQRDLRLLEAALASGGGVPTSRTITAGAGLTGGGSLAADRTIAVATADASITVNADSIEASGNFVAKDITTTGAVAVTKSGIGTTKTLGVGLINATASGSQVSPMLVGSAKHSGGTQHNFGVQNEPQSSSRQIIRHTYGTGDPATTPPANTMFTEDTSDPNFGASTQCSTFVASSGGNGFRLANNGGGIKENGSARCIVQNATAGEPLEMLSSTSTGNTGARFQLTADAGTPTAGTFLRVGFGSGSFSTEVFSISAATATRGRVYVNSIPIGWNIVTTAVNAACAIGDRVLVQGGGITIPLPAVPSVVSTRDADIIVVEVNGGVLGSPITINAAAGDLINGAASVTIGVPFGSLTLCHDGDGTNWRIVGSHLL
mgnify:CR=1 FL=1